MRIAEVMTPKRMIGIHFNGDYFLDDDNNTFLQRHPTTRAWFIMVRDGYADPETVKEANARIEKNRGMDYGFDAAWVEYQCMVTDVANR